MEPLVEVEFAAEEAHKRRAVLPLVAAGKPAVLVKEPAQVLLEAEVVGMEEEQALVAPTATVIPQHSKVVAEDLVTSRPAAAARW